MAQPERWSILPDVALVLIVEDEEKLAEVLEGYLRREGYRVECAKDGDTALALFRAGRPDLVLLDIALPRRDGLSVLKTIRQSGMTPVILVTARSEEDDRVLGLELGADDYVVKPFSPRELMARVKTVLRRASARPPAALLRAGPLDIDEAAAEVRFGGASLTLTASEYRLLVYLARHLGKVCTRSELLASALPESEALERVVDAHLKNLRKKLEAAGGHGLLETVRGFGYRLRDKVPGS